MTIEVYCLERKAHNLELELEKYIDQYHALFVAVRQTLGENLHLCDGDVCTLKVLRDEFIAQGGEL